MDGEILFSDIGRFGVLKDLVDADLKDRAQWYDRAVRNRTERFKRTNTVKPMYEGAPNLVDPIIDDLIRELKQSIVTTLWQAPHLAQFIGLDDTGVTHAENAEAAFDFHLRKTCKTRSRFSQCVDDELTHGYGLSKLVEVTGRDGLAVPEFWPVSPLSVAVPTSTLEIGQAARVCHMMRYTVAEFRRAAKANGWDSVVAENMTLTLGPAAVKDFYLWFFNTLDTELARRVMASAGKGDRSSEVGDRKPEGG